jgi:L-malate glycosyltransferase
MEGVMKIVNVISNCSAGGAEVLVKDILKNLPNNNNQIQLWVMTKVKDDIFETTGERLDFEEKYVNELKLNNIEVKFIEKKANKDIVKSWLKIRKLYDSFKPDIVHTHLEKVTLHTVIGLVGKRATIVQTVHNTLIKHPLLQKTILKYLVEMFVSISSETTQNITKLGIKSSKIIEIENGSDLERFKTKNRTFDKGRLKLIAVGRFVNQKNYPLMIATFARLKERMHNSKEKSPQLIIVGDGEKKKDIESLLIKNKLEDDIQLLGIRHDMPELLKSADIYLMSSKYEGLSISLIEAAASGLPIIATNVGSNNKIVLNDVNGYLIENLDEKEFEEKLFNLISNTEKLKLFSHESENIANKFDIHKTAEKHYNLYLKLLKKNKKVDIFKRFYLIKDLLK